MLHAHYSETSGASGRSELLLTGRWTLRALAERGATDTAWQDRLRELGCRDAVSWNCLDIEALDSVGALLLWRSWGRKLPERLSMRPEHLHIFERIAAADGEPAAVVLPRSPFEGLIVLGAGVLAGMRQVRDFIALLGQLALDLLHLLRHPGDLPAREISANIYKSGVRAMPVTALVGLLIGIALSYLSSLQLRQFGADMFIVNLLGLSIIRELGPVLVAVLVAGRSGSAMTAQLGVMRVTEEIDALATMGVSTSLRLVLPKVVALTVVTPLLVLWATALALLGGMLAAEIQLGIGVGYFLETLPKAVPVVNLWIGLAKGAVFGLAIALIACHFGLRVKPNTESLSANTTAAVVTAITVVIFIDAVFAVALRGVGVPKL
ncbi:MAG: ABC transporter permease [Rhodocyclaceae bacterium]|nr:ABC transporter permease [Rhodocyclaceae bacterium]